ncbi:MAG: AAA family ATPase [Acidimicrobiales bacterium]
MQSTVVRSLINLIGAPASFGVSGVETTPADDEDVYRQATEKVLWDLASGSGGVVFGRAGAVVLGPCPSAFHVRLDGPAAARAQRAVVTSGIDEETAWQQLRQTDHARAAYARHLYGSDPSDRRQYHLVIDTTAMPLEASVDAIVGAVEPARESTSEPDASASTEPDRT